MAIFKNQRHATNVVSILMATIIFATSGFSVSAQTVSDENSINTETQVSEEIVLPNGDTLTSNDDLTIDVIEAVKVKIKDGKKKFKNYFVPQGSIAQALDHANIKLDGDDTVNKDLTSEVKKGLKIKVNRISYKIKTKTESFAYKTVEKDNKNLYVGETKVTQQGKNGTKQVTYTSKVVNGKVKNTIVTKSKVTKKAVEKIVQVGTKRRDYFMYEDNPTKFNTKSSGGAGTIVDHNGKKIAYTKKFTGPATAYTASPGAITSVGDRVHIGGVAVDPREIPYGSKLYIETSDGTIVYGYAVANDTGGFIYSSDTLCDLFFSSRSDCINFGRRTVNVYVLA